MPKWIMFLVIAVVIAFTISDPARAADMVKAIWDGLMYLFESLITFFELIFLGE